MTERDQFHPPVDRHTALVEWVRDLIQKQTDQVVTQEQKAKARFQQANSSKTAERENVVREIRTNEKYQQTKIDGQPLTQPEANDLAQTAIAEARSRGRNVDWIASAATGSRDVATAQFITRAAAVPDNAPYSLIDEAKRYYYSFDWNGATPEAVRDARGLIDNALQRAAAIAGNNPEFGDIRKADLWQTIDLRADVYRRHRFQRENPLTAGSDEEREAIRIRNKRRDDLERTTKEYQTKIDEALNGRQEQKYLEELNEKLSAGKEKEWYNPEEAAEIQEVLRKRVDQINDLEEAGKETAKIERDDERERARARELRMRRAGMDREAIEKLIAESKDEAMIEYAKRVMRATEEGASYDQLNELWKGLDYQFETAIRDRANARLTEEQNNGRHFEPNGRNEELEREVSTNVNLMRKLSLILANQVEGDTSGRDRFWGSVKGQAYMEDLRGFTQFDDKMKRKADEIFFKILETVDKDPRGTFRESFNLYDDVDLGIFYSTLEDSLEHVGVEHQQIRDILERYTGLRNLKESFHNFRFVAGAGDLEMLAKFANNFLAEDATFMFANVRGVDAALHAQERVLQQLRANNNGYLPTELMVKWNKKSKLNGVQVDFEHRSLELQRREMAGGGYTDIYPELGLNNMEDWEHDVAFEMAHGFSIINLRFAEEIAKGLPARDFASIHNEGLARAVDPVKHLIYKFESKKPGLATLYYVLTGNKETAGKIFTEGWGADRVINAYNIDRNSPAYGLRTASMENFLEFGTRFGPDSKWGIRRGLEHTSREVYENRGIGLRLVDAKDRISNELMAKAKAEHGPFKDSTEEKLWSADWKLKNEHLIDKKTTEECKRILTEAIDRSPSMIAYHWTNDPNPEMKRLRFSILAEEGVLGTGYLKQDGHWISLNGKEIHTYSELFDANPGNDQSRIREEQHLTRQEQELCDKAWESFERATFELESDLATVEAHAFNRGAKRIEAEDLAVIADEGKRRRVEVYANRIKAAAESRYEYGGHVFSSYLDKLAEDFASGRERRIMNMYDTPFSAFEYERWGGKAFIRRIADGQAQWNATMGMLEYLEALQAHPDMKKVMEILKTKVYDNLEVYDDRVAQRVIYRLMAGMLGLYGENNWASYTGFLGDAIGNFVPTSLAKLIIDKHAEAWGPDKRYDVIHEANGKNLLAKEMRTGLFKNFHPIPGWSQGEAFTAEALELESGSQPVNVIWEYTMYTVPVAAFMMIALAATEETGGGGGGGKKPHGH